MRPRMRFTTLILLLAIGVAVYQYRRGELFSRGVVYADVQGRTRSLSKPGKPTVVGFWIARCGYCSNMMGVLDSVRRKFPADKVDVVGFFLNDGTDEDIKAFAGEEGHTADLASAYRSRKFRDFLEERFRFEGAGFDIYVIGRDGGFERVSTVDDQGRLRSPDVVLSEVEACIRKAL